jgi:hypothetical protein
MVCQLQITSPAVTECLSAGIADNSLDPYLSNLGRTTSAGRSTDIDRSTPQIVPLTVQTGHKIFCHAVSSVWLLLGAVTGRIPLSHGGGEQDSKVAIYCITVGVKFSRPFIILVLQGTATKIARVIV